MDLIAGHEIGLDMFLNLDGGDLGFFVGHIYSASFIPLQEFIDASKIDMDATLRQKYACAFEIMAKQLRSE